MTEHWSEHGNCRGVHPTTMFPERGDMAGWQRARQVCRDCPVIEQCREAGLDELHGCWGGLSPVERQQLRVKRDREKAPHGSRARYKAGCRCEPCRAANAEYVRRRRTA